jgi:hypothetical protein
MKPRSCRTPARRVGCGAARSARRANRESTVKAALQTRAAGAGVEPELTCWPPHDRPAVSLPGYARPCRSINDEIACRLRRRSSIGASRERISSRTAPFSDAQFCLGRGICDARCLSRCSLSKLKIAKAAGEKEILSDVAEWTLHLALGLRAIWPTGFRQIAECEAAPLSWSGEGVGYFGSAVTSSLAAS